MKYLILLVSLVYSFTSYSQQQQEREPDYCYFLETIFNNDSCLKILRVDATHLNKIRIATSESFLQNCTQIKMGNREMSIEYYTTFPKTPLTVFSSYITHEEDSYQVGIANHNKFVVLEAYFVKENGKWIINKLIRGIL